MGDVKRRESAELRCVVCQADLAAGAERYADDWERSRRRFPCCAGCVARFDPDLHWIPARRAGPPPLAERARVLQTFGKRLGGGDSPRVCVREALLAGIEPAVLRVDVERAAAVTAEAQDAADRAMMRGLLSWLMRGRGRAVEARDRRDARAFQDALDDLDAWERRGA